jgi:hypothetical protein
MLAVRRCEAYLRDVLSAASCCSLLGMAQQYRNDVLIASCMAVIRKQCGPPGSQPTMLQHAMPLTYCEGHLGHVLRGRQQTRLS